MHPIITTAIETNYGIIENRANTPTQVGVEANTLHLVLQHKVVAYLLVAVALAQSRHMDQHPA